MVHLVVAVRVLLTAIPMEEPAALAVLVGSIVERAWCGALDLAASPATQGMESLHAYPYIPATQKWDSIA